MKDWLEAGNVLNNRFSLSLLVLGYLFIIPYLHKTILHGLPLLEPYALSPFSLPVSWYNGYDPVFFEVLSDFLLLEGFLSMLVLWWGFIRKIGDFTLQRLLIVAFSVGIYTLNNMLSHYFAA